MALCASCGSASARGAVTCAACGRPLAPPEPGAAPAVPAGAVILDYLDHPDGEPAPERGSWGSGVPHRPAAIRNWFTGADWRPALRAVVAPTVLLLITAFGLTFVDFDLFGIRPPFTARYGGALSLLLGAFGAPWRLLQADSSPLGSYGVTHVVHVLPLTITAAWAGLLALGLRRGLRASRARTPQPARGDAYAEAARTALVAALVTLVIGLLAGADWRPVDAVPLDLQDAGSGSPTDLGMRVTAAAGLPWAVGGTLLVAGVVALAVHGADVLRAVAERNATVRGWTVAGQVACRALLITVGLLSAVAFVLVAAAGQGTVLVAALTVLPNLALLLLGFGSGATLTAANRYGGATGGDPNAGLERRASLFDLGDLGGEWRVTVLAALLGALVLAWCAHRRGLDLAGRVRLAVVHAVALSALTAVSGLLVGTVWRVAADGSTIGNLPPGSSLEDSVSLGWSGPAATLVWTALGALLLPALLARGGSAPADGPDPGEDEGEAPRVGEREASFLPPSTEVLDSGHH